MGKHISIEAADAKSALIDLAMAGDTVVITRGGAPVVEMNACAIQPRSMSNADLEWLRNRQVGTIVPDENAAELVSRLRDESER